MCEGLGVSRSGYYGWRDRPPAARQKANEALEEQIRSIHNRSRGTYGAPRIHAELRARGERCSRNRVARLMRGHGIEAKTSRRYRWTVKSKSVAAPLPNRLMRSFVVTQPNRAWVSDWTYIPTRAGWLYLAVVIDLYSRAVIGWSMSTRTTSELVCEALRMALHRRQPVWSTVVHSDQGRQYASAEYQMALKHRGLIGSMSRKGNCYDNAVVESFFHTLKTELMWFEDYRSRDEARSSIFEYIEAFYNRVRRHSTLSYRSPMDYEQLNLAPISVSAEPG